MDVAVVGAGISGVAVARAVAGSGAQVALVAPDEVRPLPCALVHPFPGRSVGTQTSWRAFATARRWLEATREHHPERVRAVPMLRPVRDADDRLWRSFERNRGELAREGLGAERLDAAAVASRYPDAVADDCVVYTPAYSVDVPFVLDDWSSEAGIERYRGWVQGIERHGKRWLLVTTTGVVDVDGIVLCVGHRIGEWLPGLPVELVSGEIAVANAAYDLQFAISDRGRHWCPGPVAASVAIGATRHRPGEIRTDAEAVRELLSPRLARVDVDVCTVWRGDRAVVSVDRRPLCGEIVAGVWVVGGLGSLGYLWSPLLGELVAAGLDGAVELPPEIDMRRFDRPAISNRLRS